VGNRERAGSNEKSIYSMFKRRHTTTGHKETNTPRTASQANMYRGELIISYMEGVRGIILSLNRRIFHCVTEPASVFSNIQGNDRWAPHKNNKIVRG
jgi:hypothetical protein